MALQTESTTTREAIQQMAQRIVDQFDPEKIILFGSHARGTATPDSDVDLLVIKAINKTKRKERVAIGVALHDINLPKDVIVATPEEADQFGHVIGSVLYPALKEGIILYDKSLT